MAAKPDNTTLERRHFSTSRLLDFLSRKELIAQTGHQVREWPLVCLKELMDNALDACEEAGIAPRISIEVDDTTLTVSDNGPGIPASVIESVLDYSIRVSSREAYVSPSRGAQGNALKTLVAMPFVLTGGGSVYVESLGIRHEIKIAVDRIRQVPKIDHVQTKSDVTIGTKITIEWPKKACLIENDENASSYKSGEGRNEKACLILSASKSRFLQIAEDYCWLNPHLSLSIRWGDDNISVQASNPTWSKWLPSMPTDCHWYSDEEFERLIAANICHEDRLVREFVSEFRGLSGTAKQKMVLESVGLARTKLSELVVGDAINTKLVGKLLAAMKAAATAVKPAALGILGEEHLLQRCSEAGGDSKSFNYKKVLSTEGLPWALETCFAYCPEEDKPRRIITGVNWSPGIVNPFRQLGSLGKSLDSILEQQRVGLDEPILFVLHISCPKVSYADRGKSSIIVEE